MKTIGYLRVSTEKQNMEKFKNDIESFAQYKKLGKIEYVEETISGKIDWKKRAIWGVLNDPHVTTIITPELSRLARSARQILEIVDCSRKKGITIFCVKEGMEINSKMTPANSMLLTILGAVSEMERDLIGERTKEALAALKKRGISLGRPKGKGKSKFDIHADAIDRLLTIGVTKTRIARDYGMTTMALTKWLQKRKSK